MSDGVFNEDLLKIASYIYISSYRMKVVNALSDGSIKIPTRIAEDSGIRKNHISKVLKELKECGVVECLNPNMRKGRLYRLTDVGVDVVGVLLEYF